jgi:hypothetical protein
LIKVILSLYSITDRVEDGEEKEGEMRNGPKFGGRFWASTAAI